MTAVATKPISAEEFYDWVNLPENRGRNFELELGEIVEMTKPGKFHGFVCGNIARILGNFAASRKKGYVCTNDTGIIVDRDPDTVRGPDILFFEDTSSAADIGRKYAETPPSVAIEVLSPNDTHGKIMKRVSEQLSFGTPLVWVVDFDKESVTIHRLGKSATVIEGIQEITGEDVLPDLKCAVSEFFKMPGQ
jgi:Uma2 family endonuclease